LLLPASAQHLLPPVHIDVFDFISGVFAVQLFSQCWALVPQVAAEGDGVVATDGELLTLLFEPLLFDPLPLAGLLLGLLVLDVHALLHVDKAAKQCVLCGVHVEEVQVFLVVSHVYCTALGLLQEHDGPTEPHVYEGTPVDEHVLVTLT